MHLKFSGTCQSTFNLWNLILQASLVKKLGGIIAIVSILNEIESLKFFTIEVQRNISN